MSNNRYASKVARVDRLAANRRRDSERKRMQVLDTVRQMIELDVKLSFARVAREASVSTWLVYNVPELRDTIRAAIDQQARDGVSRESSRQRVRSNTTIESLRADLALALEDRKALRTEIKQLRARLERKLGIEVERADPVLLLRELHEVKDLLARQQRELTRAQVRVEDLERANRSLKDDVESRETALRRVMLEANRRL